jgi:reverse gyrase
MSIQKKYLLFFAFRMPIKKNSKKSSVSSSQTPKKASFSKKRETLTIDTTQQNLLIVESPAKAKTIKKYL